MDEVLLTELGQSQLTCVTPDIGDLDFPGGDSMENFVGYKGKCQGCDTIQELNDLGLCENCADKLDRDLIRQRDWDYSSLAYGCPEEKLEAFRTDIIKHYGEKYELIAPPKEKAKKKKKLIKNEASVANVSSGVYRRDASGNASKTGVNKYN
ncbi:MAG: hypothetical protein ACMUJM_20600 [bacterium]